MNNMKLKLVVLKNCNVGVEFNISKYSKNSSSFQYELLSKKHRYVSKIPYFKCLSLLTLDVEQINIETMVFIEYKTHKGDK